MFTSTRYCPRRQQRLLKNGPGEHQQSYYVSTRARASADRPPPVYGRRRPARPTEDSRNAATASSLWPIPRTRSRADPLPVPAVTVRAPRPRQSRRQHNTGRDVSLPTVGKRGGHGDHAPHGKVSPASAARAPAARRVPCSRLCWPPCSAAAGEAPVAAVWRHCPSAANDRRRASWPDKKAGSLPCLLQPDVYVRHVAGV